MVKGGGRTVQATHHWPTRTHPANPQMIRSAKPDVVHEVLICISSLDCYHPPDAATWVCVAVFSCTTEVALRWHGTEDGRYVN